MSHPRQQMRDQLRVQLRGQAHTAWPALSTWQVQVTQGSVRVGDAERDEAARALGEHFASGRLDRDEYDERVDVALAARTRGELARVFRDLPSSTPAIPLRPPMVVRRRSRSRVPLLPVLLILLGVALLVGQLWVWWVGLGALLLARRCGRESPPRGSG